jgi:hypothetical protein
LTITSTRWFSIRHGKIGLLADRLPVGRMTMAAQGKGYGHAGAPSSDGGPWSSR